MTAPDREKALELALAQIEKNHGKGSVMRLGDDTRPPIGVIPTGSIALDVALGVGGLPRGRVVEIYGPESSGKTTVALHAVANAQAAGGIAAFIDAEHALDPEYAKALGVDTDALLVSQPDTGEQALEIADMLIRSGALDIIVIDSVAALVPRAEIEGEMGDSHVGLQARLMSQALRKITGALSNSGTTDDLHQPAAREDRCDVRLPVLWHSGHAGRRLARRRSARSSTRSCRSRCCPTTRSGARSCRRRSSTGSTTGLPSSSCRSPSPGPGGNGRAQMGLTANHLVRTPGGWREAGELVVGRPGAALAAVPARRAAVAGRARWADGRREPVPEPDRRAASAPGSGWATASKQIDYLDWKASLFGNIGQCRQHQRQGCGVRRPHAAARAGRAA